jgi:hypothetical protein
MRVLGIAVICLGAASISFAANVNFIVGERTLDEDKFEPIEDQTAFGINFDFGKEEWPFQFMAGVFISSEDTSGDFGILGPYNADLELTEVSFGVVKIFDKYPGWRPYFGAGASFISAELEGTLLGFTGDDGDDAFAWYFNGGLFYQFQNRFNLGVDLRYVTGGDHEFFGVSAESDYIQYGLILGLGF